MRTSIEKQRKAHKSVCQAVKRGILSRPDQCSRCGQVPPLARDGRSQIQGHHHDYDKPLDVEWICVKCHRIETPKPDWAGLGKKPFLAIGEKNGQSKLTDHYVQLAKRLRKVGCSYTKIGRFLFVDKKTAMRAINGEQWKHLASATPSEGSEVKG